MYKLLSLFLDVDLALLLINLELIVLVLIPNILYQIFLLLRLRLEVSLLLEVERLQLPGIRRGHLSPLVGVLRRVTYPHVLHNDLLALMIRVVLVGVLGGGVGAAGQLLTLHNV